MNLMELKKALAKKQVSKFYVFTGEETEVLRRYLDKVANASDRELVFADTLASLTNTLKSNFLSFGKKKVYVIRDDRDILTAEKVWQPLIKGTFQRDNIIILVYSDIDKRSKFYKNFSKNITYFDKLSTSVLVKYVNKEVSLTHKRAEHLVNICDHLYSSILLETDKIKWLAKSKHIDENTAFDMCIKSNAIYISPNGEIFDLLNAILSQNVKETYRQLQLFTQRGDSPIAILSLLHTNLKAILQVQCAKNYSNIGQVTGLNGFQIKNAQPFINQYTEQELIRMIKINRFCEKCIKQTGLIDSDMILDFLLIKFF